ncbi:MAG TPA: NlpC/P60 family protein [Actinomycetota bacterium]|nr:NlpC/P60 family protein [Actinomycetota bacterium]
MGRKLCGTLVTVAVAAVTLASAGPAGAAFSDVPSGHWAAGAIRYVAQDHMWMRDYGTREFRPGRFLTRRQLARAAVRAFALSEDPDPDITFSDLPESDPYYRYANVAVKRKWMTRSGRAFRPDDRVPKVELDRVLVKALGLAPEIRGLDAVATAAGTRLSHPPGFPYLVLAQQLGLHYNHPTSHEGRELIPSERVRRADAAYALYRAATARGTHRITALERYRTVVLPNMTAPKRRVVEWAFRYVGYPYVYAGEWHRRTKRGYCCGAQANGGFDCSGFAWWVLARPTSGWDNTHLRPYAGWRLPERSSRDMARGTRDRLTWKQSKATDLMFFDGDGGHRWEGVDHAGIYLGRGWVIDSSNSRDGVGLSWARSGWYRDKFVWARRLIRT